MILLDTNICIYIINGVLQVQEQSKRYNPADTYVSAISVAELMYGAAKSKQAEATRDKVYMFVSRINVIDFGASDALEYGKIRAYLTQKGELLGPLDMLIGAQAIANKFKLVTNNTREFQRIPNIALENWTEL